MKTHEIYNDFGLMNTNIIFFQKRLHFEKNIGSIYRGTN